MIFKLTGTVSLQHASHKEYPQTEHTLTHEQIWHVFNDVSTKDTRKQNTHLPMNRSGMCSMMSPQRIYTHTHTLTHEQIWHVFNDVSTKDTHKHTHTHTHTHLPMNRSGMCSMMSPQRIHTNTHTHTHTHTYP